MGAAGRFGGGSMPEVTPLTLPSITSLANNSANQQQAQQQERISILAVNITLRQECKLMFDWLISKYQVLEKLGFDANSLKTVLSVQDEQTIAQLRGDHNPQFAHLFYPPSSTQTINPGSNATGVDASWRSTVSMEERSGVIQALEASMTKIAYLLHIKRDEFARKLQLYELALLCVTPTKAMYCDVTSLPTRLANMLMEFHQYVREIITKTPLLAAEITNQLQQSSSQPQVNNIHLLSTVLY